MLLVAHQAVEFVHLPAHALLALLPLLAFGHTQVPHRFLKLFEQALRLLRLALARQALDLVEHVAHIPFGHAALVRIALLVFGPKVRVALRPLGELAHIFVHGLPKLLGQALDFLRRGTALQRFLQSLFGLAEAALGGAHLVLDRERHLPELLGDGDKIGIRTCGTQGRGDHAQAEIFAGTDRKILRPGAQGIERRLHRPDLIGIENELAPLLDQRPRQRHGERPLRNDDVARLAQRLLAGIIGHVERQAQGTPAQG